MAKEHGLMKHAGTAFWSGFEKRAEGVFTELFSDKTQRLRGKKEAPRDQAADYPSKAETSSGSATQYRAYT